MHGKGPDSVDMTSGPRSRSTSVSSDTQLSRVNFLSTPSVNPNPAFIASSAASQIVTTDQEFNTADFVAEEEGNGVTGNALVTPAALAALNGFLDHLLFNILAAAKSTRLSYMRPAVADVLKPRLAREVVSAADDELREYMGGAEDEEFEFGGQGSDGEFNLVRSWKLTRLRCMVYTRLGDMEEDDEDEYIAQEGLAETDGAPQRFTSHVGNITPAAAIFLTSIIEYIGEQALVISGETARSRLVTKMADRDEVTESGAERSNMNRLVVEDLDMEKLALNSTLGRLWRTWRKSIRSKTMGRAASRESLWRPSSTQPIPASRKSSIVTADEPFSRSISAPVAEEEAVDPASIPLPMSEHDVREIEVPGFSAEPDGEVQTLEAVVAHKVRPRSLMVFLPPTNSPRSPSSTASSPILSPTPSCAKAHRHFRSRSLPNASYFPDRAWENGQTDAQNTGEVSSAVSDDGKRLETMYEYDEQADPAGAQADAAIPSQDADNNAESEGPPGPGANDLPGAEEERTVVQEGALLKPLSVPSMEVETSQEDSGHAPSSSVLDRQEQEAEVIEGQGMCEKPKQALQRPKRKSSKDPTRSESTIRPVTEDQPPKQGAKIGESATGHEASTPSDTSHSTPEFFVPEPKVSNEEPCPDNPAKEPNDPSDKSRPATASTTSSGSERSGHSRTLSKTNHLALPSGSTQSSGRSISGLERASVQRVSIRPSPSITSSTYSNPRRSDSFTSAPEKLEKRPVTAGSATSQVSTKLKGLIGRQPGDPASPRFRSSSETSQASGGSGESGNLDKLIKSDETLRFTLTPKSMREMEEPGSPRWRTTPHAENADQFESAGVSGKEPQRQRESNASRKTADMALVSKTSSVEASKPKPAERMSLQAKSKTVQARDARPAAESIRDFAEFIKSTGPPGPIDPGPLPVPGSPRSSDVTEALKKGNPPSRGNAPKLQARSATAPKDDQTHGLIDFLREGPPAPGGHPIPRVTAPFRDPTDSEASEPERAERVPTRASQASTLGSSMANKSFTSVGSRTGLLDSTRRATAQPGASTNGTTPSEGDAFPARKQSRVRDPYAIDLDDDELDDLLEPQKPKREEESLMDFLRNVPPPDAQPSPQPFNLSSNKMRVPPKSPLRQSPGNSLAGQSNYTVKVGMERNAGSAMPGKQTETSALADFLKNTAPPEPPTPRTVSAGAGKKESGANTLSRLFTRRKKVEV